MRAAKFLLVSEEIAERAGLKDLRTRTDDGRYVLYEGDLKMVHLQPEEYVTGLAGVEVITEAKAQELVEAAKAADKTEATPAEVEETPEEDVDTETESETEINKEADNGTD